MYSEERLQRIMDMLNKYNYVTVKYLVNELHYSNATVNRDLKVLEERKMIKRSYGGVELIKSEAIPFQFRSLKMKPEKNKIACEAAKLIKNGDTIFIDGSTTTQYLCSYIVNRKNITVVTNNLAVVSILSSYNINVICLGGKVYEAPSVLNSDLTVENAYKYKVDKMFFSTGAFSADGQIDSRGGYYLLLKTMALNAKKLYYLADHAKADRNIKEVLFDFDKINYVISDYKFPEGTKNKYKNTKFVEVD